MIHARTYADATTAALARGPVVELLARDEMHCFIRAIGDLVEERVPRI